MIKLKNLLVEKLSPDDANKIFNDFGVPNAINLSTDDLKAAHKKLILTHHPDKNPENTKQKDIDSRLINSAFDILKSISPSYHINIPTNNNYNDSTNDDCWAQAGYSGGSPNSANGSNTPGNINYIKKKAWIISAKPPCTPNNDYSFSNWDGSFFRGGFSVFSTPSKLFEISTMLANWETFHHIVAVFYFQKISNDKTIFLINHLGKEISPPKPFTHDSFNNNPGNDPEFIELLRKLYPPHHKTWE